MLKRVVVVFLSIFALRAEGCDYNKYTKIIHSAEDFYSCRFFYERRVNSIYIKLLDPDVLEAEFKNSSSISQFQSAKKGLDKLLKAINPNSQSTFQ